MRRVSSPELITAAVVAAAAAGYFTVRRPPIHTTGRHTEFHIQLHRLIDNLPAVTPHPNNALPFLGAASRGNRSSAAGFIQPLVARVVAVFDHFHDWAGLQLSSAQTTKKQRRSHQELCCREGGRSSSSGSGCRDKPGGDCASGGGWQWPTPPRRRHIERILWR